VSATSHQTVHNSSESSSVLSSAKATLNLHETVTLLQWAHHMHI